MLIQIGQLVEAATNISILKWTESIDKSIIFAANATGGFYLLNGNVCTIIDFVYHKNFGRQIVKKSNGVYISLYNREMWFTLWSSEWFYNNVTIN